MTNPPFGLLTASSTHEHTMCIIVGLLHRFFFSSYLTELRELLQSVTSNISRPGRAKEDDRSIQLLEEINENLKKLNRDKEKDILPQSLPTPKVPEVTIDIVEPIAKSEPAKEPKTKHVQVTKRSDTWCTRLLFWGWHFLCAFCRNRELNNYFLSNLQLFIQDGREYFATKPLRRQNKILQEMLVVLTL